MGFFGPRTTAAEARTLPSLPITSNLALRLDASVFSSLYDATSGGSVVADGGTVARWEDQSGNGRHATQGTANNRPVFRKYFGDIGGVYFDGSNDRLDGDLFSSAPSSETIFMIGQCNPTAVNNNFVRLFTQRPPTGDDFSSTGHFICLITDTDRRQIGSYAGGSFRSGAVVKTNNMTLGAIHTGTSLKTRFNGTNNADYAHTIATGDKYAKYSIGEFNGVASNLLLFEVLVYSTSLTDSEVGQLEDYAKDKLRWYF